MNKPKKTIYPNQKDAFEKFRKFILPHLRKIPEIKEAMIWASLAEGKFGTYEREYREHTGSDVDLVLLLEEGKDIPEAFKDLEVHKSWFDGYLNKSFRHFDYDGNDHKVDVLVVKRDKLDVAKESLKGRSKRLYVKKGSKGELK